MSTNFLQMPDSLVVDECNDSFGRFVLQPLERGYGVTIGNSFRRVLLSSLPGNAITSVKIEGVKHEYSSVEGVSEDVYDIVLNLKQVRFKQNDQSSGVIRLTKKGPGTIKAGDLNDVTTEYTVLNPELLICTLSEGAKVEMEFRVGRGKGYVTSEENVQEGETELNIISMDAKFTPVVNVNYTIENVRVGKRTDYEKLVLEVSTDGSVNPKEALTIAGRILKDHIEKFITERINEPYVQVEEEVDSEKVRIGNLLRTSIEDLNLSVRAYNCLKSANILTIGELVSKEESELLKFRNFGKKSLSELIEVIEEKNLHFGMDVAKYLS